MKIITTNLGDLKPDYNMENIGDVTKIVFIDIETTGLTAKNTNLYMIGCAYYKDDEYHLMQWFAEKYEEELQLLTAFFDFVKDYEYLVHYNGNNFDIPYLLQKCQQFGLDKNFDSFVGVDIFRRIAPYKEILALTDMKQKTIEEYLGISRDDTYSGRELINKYHDYVCEGSESLLNELLLHNEDDLKGMLKLVSMLALTDLFNKPIRVMKAQATYFDDVSLKRSQEIIMKLRLESPLPAPISFRGLGCYFSGNGIDASLKVPLYEEEFKYFYANYKNYYYLPAEDIAMHKSVASFVDKEHRVQANASNCYTRKKALFLPEWDILFTPFFKKDYHSKEIFFELTDDFKKSRSGFSMYASHVLNKMLEAGID